MSAPEGLSRQVAVMLFRKLSGFQGYPPLGAGEDHFLDCFQGACISVEHGKAVIACFDQTMPTLREIKDAAFNLRAKFELTVSLKEQWERQFGPPSPMVVDFHVAEDRPIDELWKKLRERYPGSGSNRRPWKSYSDLAKDARELGYADIAKAWERF